MLGMKNLQSFLNKVSSQPYKYDYFSLLRQLESVKFITGGQILGKAISPKMEKIRIRQKSFAYFCPTQSPIGNLITSLCRNSINGFGLFGHLAHYRYI